MRLPLPQGAALESVFARPGIECTAGEEELPVQKGDSIFIPAGSGAYTLTGNCRFLKTSIGTE